MSFSAQSNWLPGCQGCQLEICQSLADVASPQPASCPALVNDTGRLILLRCGRYARCMGRVRVPSLPTFALRMRRKLWRPFPPPHKLASNIYYIPTRTYLHCRSIREASHRHCTTAIPLFASLSKAKQYLFGCQNEAFAVFHHHR